MPPELSWIKLKETIELKYLEGLSVINQRVPALEISYKDKQDKKIAKKWFSMMTDANVQETLH